MLRPLIFVFLALWTVIGPAHAQDPGAPAVQQQANNTPPGLPVAAAAPIDLRDLPPELREWVPWITTKHPDMACPVAPGGRACLWPGVLVVDARAEGARLDLSVEADRDLPLPLPGGPGTWPQEVRVDGRAVPVLDVGGVPTVALEAGRHRVSAAIPWATRPASLPVPGRTGRVELRVDGEAIAWPRIDGDGLRLGAVQVAEREGERLDLEVSRKVRDGVPVVVETLVVIRASGAGREVDLGAVTLPGTRPVSLSATLPARFDPDSSLVIQVRPGTWEVRFEAVHDGPVAELGRPTRSGPWPETEFWAVATDDRTRAVNLDGAAGVDPARTTVPPEWRSLPVHAVGESDVLRFEELRRGEPDPAPNQLSLRREIWVDLDGGGLTVRDYFSGTMSRGWRLDAQAPAALGHVSASGADQVITDRDGAVGVELRSTDVALVAESRIEGRPLSLPAVGWDADVQSLQADLYLPPGWSLFAGTGVDSLDGSILDRWTLFDLFFVLILAMATSRLLGRGWGALALVALVLARHEGDAPQWTWAVLLVLVGLLKVVPEGRPRQAIDGLRVLCLLFLAAVLVPFAVDQLQTGLFPQLKHRYGPVVMDQVPDRYSAITLDTEFENAGGDWGGMPMSRSEAPMKKGPAQKNYLSSQVDPSAVVQTGPGVPRWAWETQPLRWSGPVSRDHTMRLLLIGPAANAVLALLRVLLLGALALRLAGAKEWRSWSAQLAGAAPVLLAGLVGWLAWATPALAGPDPQVLAELERRLVQAPACAPRCVDVAAASLSVADDRLVYEAEIHAGADASWPIPGPTGTWVPARVTVDGVPATAMARLADGFLHVRVDAGVHRVRVEGPVPPTDVVALAFGIAPRRLVWSGEGWALDGHRADGTVDASVQLARMLGSTTTAQSAENLAPWLEVHRELDLGIPWRVRTTIRRVGPTDYPVTVKVPLLPGEAVTEGGFEPDGGVISATLDRDQRELAWLSTLESTETVTLTAPSGVPWTEVWTLSCSPIFHCGAEGPAPLAHTEGGAWSPRWRVWPGESVVVSVARPPGVEGQTVTIDRAELIVRPGRRQLAGELHLDIRSSQGGRQAVTLPEGAELQSVQIGGQARPLQLTDAHELLLPIQPGAQSVTVLWQQPHPPAIWDRVPAVHLGGPAVNVTVVVEPMLERWLALLIGPPRWGPVPLMWTYVILVVGLAFLLARAPWSPLKTWQWALLGLGMTQVPVFAPMVVVVWLMALAWRKARPASNPWAFDAIQLGLLGLTAVALICLYASIHAGLLWQPDMQVAGGDSHARYLKWFADRSDGAMPRPTVVSFPMWTWRVAMLVWSLWLAGSLVSWLPWGFRAWTTDGWYRWIELAPKKKAPPAVDPAGADTDVTGPVDDEPGPPGPIDE